MIIQDEFVDLPFKQVNLGDSFNYAGHVFLRIKDEKGVNTVDLTTNELRKFSDQTVVVPLEGILKVTVKRD